MSNFKFNKEEYINKLKGLSKDKMKEKCATDLVEWNEELEKRKAFIEYYNAYEFVKEVKYALDKSKLGAHVEGKEDGELISALLEQLNQ